MKLWHWILIGGAALWLITRKTTPAVVAPLATPPGTTDAQAQAITMSLQAIGEAYAAKVRKMSPSSLGALDTISVTVTNAGKIELRPIQNGVTGPVWETYDSAADAQAKIASIQA
jgi:hypothetical protein